MEALDLFFEVERRGQSLNSFLIQWQLAYDQAVEKSGLQVNDTGKSYLP